MALERVDSLIGHVMKKHPDTTPKGLAAYFEDVHQELAPLARALENEVDTLKQQRAELLTALEELNSVSANGFLYDDPARVKARKAIASVKGNQPQKTCTYPKCNCPFDAPADPNWCARGYPKMGIES